MLSMANVRSSSAAANYFAADNYYASADADRSGQWIGDGARRLGIEGHVEAQSFDALLRGELPSGETVGNPGQAHRPGTDLTFSLPKSWSLLALVGKDDRIIAAYRDAVVETLSWAENNLAETRTVDRGTVRTEATGNLAVALFQHDTNRSQEPNLHFHAVIANVTQGRDGKWRTLKNDRLWQNNTLLNSIAMARFRLEVEKLGYETGPVLKHGNFEAGGITREQVMAFSTRRKEVLEARRGPGLEAGRIAALDTRAAKEPIEDRAVLATRWETTAQEAGLDLASLVDGARLRAETIARRDARPLSLVERGLAHLKAFAAKIGGREESAGRDPLVPAHVLKQRAPAIAAAQAVASASRHLSQREAAFERTALYKAALDFGLPTTIGEIEGAVRRLVRGGALVEGKGPHAGWIASRDALETETRILAWANEGRGATTPILPSDAARDRVAASAQLNHGMRLNEGQLSAADLILASADRTIAVEGVAGAGKSSVLAPVAQVLREEGRDVLGLAVQNTLVQMLERDTGIRSKTLARFLGEWRPLLENPADRMLLGKARSELGKHVLVLDEASMVANADKEQLIRLANLAGAERLVLMGDRKQLGAVDAGKPFAVLQEGGLARAEMSTNLRGRDPVLRQAQAAAQAGQVREALALLSGNTLETSGDGAVVAIAFSNPGDPCTRLAAVERELRAILDSAAPHLKAATQSGLDARFGARLAALRAECRPPGDTPPARPPGPNDDLFVPGAPTSPADLERQLSRPPEVVQIPTNQSVDPKVEEAIAPVGGILAGPGSPCAKVEAVSALVRDNYTVLDPLQIEALIYLIEARHGVQLNILRNACIERDKSAGGLPPEPSDFVPGPPYIPNPATPPPSGSGFSYDPETDSVNLDVGLATDSTTFCTFRTGSPITVPLELVTPECTFGCDTDPPPCSSVDCPLAGPSSEVPPDPADPGPIGEPDPCAELGALKIEFDRLRTDPSTGISYAEARQVPDPNRGQIAALLPRIVELVAKCGPCARRQQLVQELAEVREEVAAIERSRRALGLPVHQRDLTQADLQLQALLLDLANINDAECPKIEGFLELLPPSHRGGKSSDPDPVPQEKRHSGDDGFSQGPVPAIPPSGSLPPCEQADKLLEAIEQEVRNSNNETFSPVDRQAAVDRGQALEARLKVVLAECERGRSGAFPGAPKSEPAPEPAPAPVQVFVKATSRALQDGTKPTSDLSGQVVRLFDPGDIDVALPTERGTKSQDGHDRDPLQAVTDGNGDATIRTTVRDLPKLALLTGRSDAAETGVATGPRFRLEFDATPQDSINLIGDGPEAFTGVLSRASLFGNFSDISQIGNLTVGTLVFDKDKGNAVTQVLRSEFPDLLIEPNLCRIKEPAAVTEYHACKLEERTPPQGARHLTPPGPQAELPGAVIHLSGAVEEREQ